MVRRGFPSLRTPTSERNALMRRAPLAAAAVVMTFLLSSCAPEQPMPSPSPSPRPSTPAASGDGVLRVGTLLPTSGELAFLSPAQVAGVELAVREINELGGVLGAPVEVFHRNSGDASTSTAETSYTELVDRGVDVIVGPASSVLAERLLPLAIADGVALISPSATAAALTTLADDGLLLRTSPSAALQGRALGQLLDDAGAASVAMLTFDDEESAAVTSVLAETIDARTLTVSETFSSGSDVTALAALIAESGADAVVVSSPFGPEVPTAELLTALLRAGVARSSLWLTRSSLSDYSQDLPSGTLEGVRGVLDGREPGEDFVERVLAMDPGVTDLRYAAEAYDAVMVAALAATVAKDDGGRSVGFAAIDVTGAGIKCMSFGECLDVLLTQPDIDYDGASGPLALAESGDPTVAHYRVFAYGSDNRPEPAGDVFVE